MKVFKNSFRFVIILVMILSCSYPNVYGLDSSIIDMSVSAAISANDAQPPSAPSGLTLVNKTFTTISLSWSKAADNIAVRGYMLFRDGKKIITVTKTTFTNTDLIPGRTYTYAVKAYDAAGNVSESSVPLEATTIADIQQPSAPGPLSVSSADYTTVTLSWGPSSDNTGIKGYQIFRNGRKVATTSATSYMVKGLAPGTIYTFFVKSYDAAGNYSLQSNSITGATVQDKLNPSVPSGLKTTNITETEVCLSWAPASDNVKVKSYEVYCNGEKAGSISKPNFTVKNLNPGKSYSYTVKAIDVSGNLSIASEPLKVTTLKDNIKPSAPTGLKAASIHGKSVRLEWNASKDNIKVKGYRIFCNGMEIATTSKTSRTVKSPLDLGIDIYYVQAYDLADNNSERSNKITVIIP